MSEEAHYLRAPYIPIYSTEPKDKDRERNGKSKGDEGPPLWYCDGCGKEMEGSWSGEREYPHCERGKGCYVAHAIAWAPKGMIIVLGQNMPFRDKKYACSQECVKKIDPQGVMDIFPQGKGK